MIRVRFAPSPTGYLHVGGARTALFNWLFARHNKGTFVLRIEDTDQERSTEASIEHIIEAMQWLGISWDEYYRQTEHSKRHQQAALELMDRKLAYEHDGAWWFRVPEQGELTVHDALLGDITFRHEQLKDFVIRRSDGSFVYNFVVVVDDADMRITHVIRGDDHTTNTPRQILLYQALEKPLPQFAHLPMILGPDRTRLSKRHGVTSVLEYRRRGFLPEAMVNFLARLGWSHGDQEVFTGDQLVELFTLQGVGSSAAMFDEVKLHWINQQHMKAADLARIVELVKPFALKDDLITEAMWDQAGQDRLLTGAKLLRDRSKTFADLASSMRVLFPVPLEKEEDVVLSQQKKEVLQAVIGALSTIQEFTPENVQEAVRTALKERGVGLRDVAHDCRMAITGTGVGPGLFDMMSVIGRDCVKSRLEEIL